MMIVRRFLCNNIARMGLQSTTKMRDACEQSDAFFVTTLQGRVYKAQQTREMHHDDRLIMHPKRRFCKDEQKINADFRGPFQRRDYSMLLRPSKIFVWGA